MLHVCPLSHVHATVAATEARHLVTLLKDTDRIQRPASIAEHNHLILGMDDISEPLDGYMPPGEEHVTKLIGFARGWDRAKPLVVHCYAGISRSTAGAFVIACALNPGRSELAIAQALRSASATASPNTRIVGLADRALGRGGRMIAAVETIGRGCVATEAEPFRLALD
jgi:predicted protein tyrosine phosphatase